MTALGLERSSPFEEELELPAALARDGIDLLHSPLWLLPALLPCRAVVTVHDAIPATHPELTSDAFRPVWNGAAAAVSRAAAVVCPTEHAREAVVRALGLEPARVHVVPEAPAAVFSVRAPEVVAAALRELHVDEPYFVVVGSLERRKNPDGVLDALASLAPGARPLVLFAGPAAGFDLAAEAARRVLGDRARHLGLVSDETLAALYTGARGLVMASRAEGFGLPIVEAWACGCPVIASTATCLPEVAGDAALLVDPEDPRAIAAAMNRLLVEGDLRDELRRRGSERLSTRFSPAAVTGALARLYDALEACP
jgi:glycosyltransferase involved in cell wall biosynthesis